MSEDPKKRKGKSKNQQTSTTDQPPEISLPQFPVIKTEPEENNENNEMKGEEKMSSTKDIRYQTIKTRERTLREILQVTVLMALINDKYSYVMHKQYKKIMKEMVFPMLSGIYQDGEKIIDFDEATDEKFEKEMSINQVKNIRRDKRRMFRITVNNTLFDIATFVGYKFEGRTTTTTKFQREQLERIKAFVIGDKYIRSEAMMEIGVKLNKIIIQQMEMSPRHMKTMVIEKGTLYKPLMEIIDTL